MEESLKILEARAPAETSLPVGRLQSQFLAPMRETLRCGRRMAELEFPDYLLSRESLGQKIKELIRSGKEAESRQYLAQVREKAAPLLEKITQELGSLPQTPRYVAQWQQLLEWNHWKR